MFGLAGVFGGVVDRAEVSGGLVQASLFVLSLLQTEFEEHLRADLSFGDHFDFSRVLLALKPLDLVLVELDVSLVPLQVFLDLGHECRLVRLSAAEIAVLF